MNEQARQQIHATLRDAVAAIKTVSSGQVHTSFKLAPMPMVAMWIPYEELRPRVYGELVRKSGLPWNEWAARMEHAFKLGHADHLDWIGTVLWDRTKMDGGRWLEFLLNAILARWGSLAVDDRQIGSLVQDLSDFVDRPKVPMRFIAPIPDIIPSQDFEPFKVADGIEIRQMTDEDATLAYGGFNRGERPKDHLAFFGDYDVEKVLGNMGHSEVPLPELSAALQSVLLGSLFWGEVRIGHEGVRFFAKSLCPFDTRRFHALGRPAKGRSGVLKKAHIQALMEHVKYFRGRLHPSLRVATQRYWEAKDRLNPQDAALDAVIGMEAILLYGQSRRDGKSGPFSKRYATLFSSAKERADAKQVGVDLYALRNMIAHGDELPEEVKIGSENHLIHRAAGMACMALHRVIMAFITEGERPAFTQANYWNDRLREVSGAGGSQGISAKPSTAAGSEA